MTDFEYIIFERKNSVAWVTFNRPDKLNAVHLAMRDEIANAIDTIRGDSSIRAAVFTGAGRAFCTGADLSGGGFLVSGEGEVDNALDMRKSNLRWGWTRLIQQLWECEKPIISAVNGWAMGFGFHLALYSDLLLASDQARFQQVWARRGLPIEAGGAYILPRLLGINRAKALVLLAEPFSADKALELGLAYQVVSAEELLPTVTELAEQLAAGPTRLFGMHKRQLQMSLDSTLERSLYDETGALVPNILSPDTQEARRAFHENRDPVYTGT